MDSPTSVSTVADRRLFFKFDPHYGRQQVRALESARFGKGIGAWPYAEKLPPSPAVVGLAVLAGVQRVFRIMGDWIGVAAAAYALSGVAHFPRIIAWR